MQSTYVGPNRPWKIALVLSVVALLPSFAASISVAGTPHSLRQRINKCDEACQETLAAISKTTGQICNPVAKSAVGYLKSGIVEVVVRQQRMDSILQVHGIVRSVAFPGAVGRVVINGLNSRLRDTLRIYVFNTEAVDRGSTSIAETIFHEGLHIFSGFATTFRRGVYELGPQERAVHAMSAACFDKADILFPQAHLLPPMLVEARRDSTGQANDG